MLDVSKRERKFIHKYKYGSICYYQMVDNQMDIEDVTSIFIFIGVHVSEI